MFVPFVDLHTHTQRSDGRLSPEELVSKAFQSGIRILAVTDHNYTEDLTELREFAASQFDEEMTLIQGAEVSALYGDGIELHIVALGFDPENPNMKAMLERHRPDRRPYIEQILAKLRENQIDLGSYDDIVKRFPDTKYIGRMALARCLFEDGYTTSVDQSFDLYLGAHGERRAYVKNPLKYSSLEEVVRTIIQAQGTPVLAHLLYYSNLDNGNRTGGEDKEKLVRTFSELVKKYGGVGGIEVYYTRYKDMDERLYLLRMAQKYGLLISGGSDYHEQESWETLEHRTSCSACSDLLDHLGIKVDFPLSPTELYILSGYSGAGKGTVAEELKKQKINNKPVALIQSCTSRSPRSDNDHYTFLTREEFTAMANAHKFLEFNDDYVQRGYGTPVDAVKEAIESNHSVLLEIDRIGLTHLLTDGKINPNLVRSVFIVADAAVVEERLRLRGTETRQKIRSRLETAKEESYHLELYDAVIENLVVDDTVQAVIDVFEGDPPVCNFDPVKFRSDMDLVLASY